eukprot:8842973-Pyramimonas_sp.AAC.1
MVGCERFTACLELLVVGRGYGAKAPRGLTGLPREVSGCILGDGAWLEALQAVLRLIVVLESWGRSKHRC